MFLRLTAGHPGSRLGRRLVAVFILCAIAPLAIATAFLVREFDQTLQQSSQGDLDKDVRVFGAALMNKLVTADESLDGLLRQEPLHAAQLERLRSFPWVDRAYYSGGTDTTWPAGLPVLNDAQQAALRAGRPLLTLNRSGDAGQPVYLVRSEPRGGVLWISLAPAWLWADVDSYLADTSLSITAGNIGLVVQRTPRDLGSHPLRSSWELFLRSQFETESWRLSVARDPESTFVLLRSTELLFPAVLSLTLLLVSLLSITFIRRRMRPLQELVAGTERIARRDFSRPITAIGNDEISGLARSFNSMSDDLKRQFTALETLSDVDRLLLKSPAIEEVLDALLPRVAAVLGCDAVAVALADRDSANYARIYDFYTGGPAARPVRRIAMDLERLESACVRDTGRSGGMLLDAGTESLLAPLMAQGARTFSMYALRTAQRLSGVLLIGYQDAPQAERAYPVRPEEFASRIAVALDNIEQNARLQQQAHFDALTGLANRRLFTDRLHQGMAVAASRGAVLYIDIDHFKRINDTDGHAAGDQLLCVVAERLKHCVGGAGLAARLGGDEFAVVIPTLEGVDTVRQLAQHILKVVAEPIDCGGHTRRVSASIGIAVWPGDGNDIDRLMMSSDVAMYRAKELGRDQAVYFEREMQQRLEAVAAIESGLHRALDSQELHVAYQPIFDSSGTVMRSAEALMRWPSSPGEPARSPTEFIPVAEESGLIVELGRWVLHTACRQFITWRQQGLVLDYISVNVSVRQLVDAKFPTTVRECLAQYAMQPGELQLEITESVLAEVVATGGAIENLAGLGVRLALDDFGTGYSSLSYLRTYPINAIKIDRAFVNDLPHSEAACRLVEAMLAMAKAVRHDVIAEGVETPAQLEFLAAAGCNGLQGFLLGRPMESDDLLSFSQRGGTHLRLRRIIGA